MAAKDTMNADGAAALALNALVWTLGEPSRADRLLALTGLDPTDLRTRANDPAVLGAVLGFLESHEPDLIACAADLDVAPDRLVRANALLSA
ncbi:MULTISPECIES: DUF3572 domain-containing protein [Sphingomonas]|jgi:hypothetical protein|uniref:DUF3572 domain-containing protein n=2 Tax=Sphingomonas TaxID=13687 RepID=A0A7W9BS91_9SPHN|nr:DUF3572 domain-containing protein [Sphingomonas prati]MBB5729186.1 hypothetical protein [Sphingomonas prati]GGE84441.1 hypothetical protein GCM10011404_16450 [Sphingomonas prati]